MEILATPINDAGKWLFGKLKIQFRRVYHYNDNFNNLGKQIIDLQDKKTDIETQLEEAQRDLKLANAEVQTWLKDVESIQSRVTSLNEEAGANKRCLLGLCPDLWSRRRLSKQAVRLLDEIKDLQEKGNFRSVAHDPPPLPVVPVQQDCVENLKSRDEITERVMSLLRDERVKSIGVYGMGGIGKTTLVETVNNRLQGTDVFRKVIKLVVSKDPDTKMIQLGIAERLGLTFEDGSSEDTKADKLRRRLEAEKSVLIIFDDVWDVLKLAPIGIPCGNLDVGCKLIITTRDRNVCTGMGIEPIYQIEIGLLSEEESMILFKEKAGAAAVESPDLRPIAEEIVAKCKGSPLAISTIGSSLKSGEVGVWKNALGALKNPQPSDLHEIMLPVINSLKYSYDRLEGEGIKLCFLFCCLFPEDYNISFTELRNYGVGEGFLKLNGGTLEDAANKLLFYITKLKNHGLLLEGDKEGHVKMHDVVRDVAIWIASKEKGFSVNVDKRSTDSFEIQNYKRVSFMKIENLELSVPSDCPNLRTVMIRNYSESPIIDEESSFERMTTLVILEMRIDYPYYRRSVPNTLGFLTNLQALFIVGYDLSSKISMIGGMKKLKILDLQSSGIGELPEEIGNLSNLKCLNLTLARFSAVAPGVMSKLKNLEELYARTDYFDGWDKEVASLVNLSSLEICLRHEVLESASFSFPWKNLKHFFVSINWDFSENSSLGLVDETKNGLYLSEVNPTSNLNYKSLCNLTHELKLKSCHGLEGGFKNLEYLEVEESDSVEYLMSFEEESSKNCLQDSFQGLKKLKINGLVNMKKIVHGCLEFVNVPPLGTNSTSPCFQNLTSLIISDCPKLESIFPFSIAQCLQQLIGLEIVNCRNLVYVIEKDEEEDEGEGEKEELALAVQHHPVPDPILVLLPSLKDLLLDSLPSLEGIYQGNLQFNSPLEYVRVFRCPNLRKLPLGIEGQLEWCHGFKDVVGLDLQVGGFKNLEYLDVRQSDSVEYLMSFEEESAKNCLQDSFQGLKELTIVRLVNMKKIVHGRLEFVNLPPLGTNSTSPCFQNLKYLAISDCPKLESIFPFSIAQCLQQLIRLEIGDCRNLVYVIQKDEGLAVPDPILVLLPSLKHLFLVSLPSLEGIYQGNLQFNSPLESVVVRDCPKLRKLPLGPQTISTLQRIKVKLLWFHGFKDVVGFKNLEYLDVRESDSVEYLMSFEEESAQNCLQVSFQGLGRLIIDGLVNMKKIIHGRLEFVNLPPLGTNSTSPCFQNLKYLTIWHCPILESIFPFSIAQCLQQLIELIIFDCPNLVYVIQKDEEEDEGEGEKEELALAVQHHPVPDPILVLLPSLKHLELALLPSLEGIYQGNLQFNSPLESVEVCDCPNLRKLPLGPQTISTLQRIEGKLEWFETFEWEDDSRKSHLRTIFAEIWAP